jgi:hypothetical protein
MNEPREIRKDGTWYLIENVGIWRKMNLEIINEK